jgi:hypothetical protein
LSVDSNPDVREAAVSAFSYERRLEPEWLALLSSILKDPSEDPKVRKSAYDVLSLSRGLDQATYAAVVEFRSKVLAEVDSTQGSPDSVE